MESYTGSVFKVKGIHFISLYLRNLGASLVGFIIIIMLNVFTPLDFFKIQRAFLFAEGGWTLFFLFIPMALALVILLQIHFQRPITNLSTLLNNEKDIPAALLEKGRQRLLNLPFIIALINLTIYLVIPVLVASSFYFFKDTPIRTCLFLIFRVFMIGLIAAGLSFFLVEDHSRKKLVPSFFPKGRLNAQPGTIKISVLRRIRVLNMAGTLNPMIILLITLTFVLWEVQGNTISAGQLGKEVFLFTLLLCGIFITIALRLNVLVGNSILTPIREMLDVVREVRNGDFTTRIKVFSNDEIGILGDAGNDMIEGLLEREKIRDTFGKYVTPEIRDLILEGSIPLNGERTEATLLFADLRDFTHYVEENDPEEVIRSMRAYFTAMQRAIGKHKGLVLQYVGDEIEAVFGVPLSYDDHTDKAVMAALEMRKSLKELNKQRIKEGKVPFRHGIGIHTGEVLAGNTGSEDRLSYALIGDTVNLASRIQELTKTFHCDVMVSESTVKRLSHAFNVKKEMPQPVKGHSKHITVYQVLE